MKKAILLLLSLALLSTGLFAMSSSTGMEVSAFKNYPTPTSNSRFKIYNLLQNYNNEITGFTNLYDINSRISSSRTIERLFSVEFTSNQRTVIQLTIYLSPFVNQGDRTDVLPVTYSASISTAGAVKGTNPYLSSGKGNSKISYYAEYTPSITVSPQTYADTTVPVSIIFNPTGGKVRSGYATGKDVTVNNVINWSETTLQDILSQSTNSYNTTLPGFTTGQNVSATATFGITIDQTAYEDMMANADYVATIAVMLETT